MPCELCGEILSLLSEAAFRENDRGQLRVYCLSCADELAAIEESKEEWASRMGKIMEGNANS